MVDQKYPFCYNINIVRNLITTSESEKHMKQELRAVGMVTGMVAVAVSVTIIVKLALANISAEAVPYVIGAVFLGIAFYTLYSICLAQIKYTDKIKEIAKK
jgi:hypothetical protein